MSKNEAETRKEMIDTRLMEAGWDINDLSKVVQEYDLLISADSVKDANDPYTGHQFCDYVLMGRDGNPMAVVEAKRSTKDPAIGREQAKQYCHHIQSIKKTDLPFCFYTNGHEIFYWDLNNYPPRKVYGYPTIDDFERFNYIRKYRKPLAGELINTRIAGRDYQLRAIRSVMEAVENKRRKFLLIMATGTGKTRTCIALVSALMKGGWAERVLFLVDRIALRDQTLDEFKEHLPDEPRWPREGDRGIETDRRIYVSTYPTMLNVINDEKNRLSPHFFDLIVVDESHRSIYNTYQDILKYFNAIVLGLTATPTDVIDHNTFELFECEDGIPTFAFSYDEAVNHIPPYLCNFQVMKIITRFQQDGINKRTVTLEDQKRLIHEGKDIEEINFEGTELEKSVINHGTNVLIVKEFMEECIKDPNGVLPGKTIFFCISMSHARRIEKIFDALYPQYKGELAKVIVSDDPRVYGKGGLLDQFKKNDMPRVGISVDMLDTGIDVREIVNLVFAKPVYSYTKFWQMIGRGTRLLDETNKKPWCPEKDMFLILDCWDNFEYFKLTPKGKDVKQQIPLPVKYASVRLDKIEKCVELGNEAILKKEVDALRKQIDELPKQSITVREASSVIEKLEEPNYWNNITYEKIRYLKTELVPLFRSISQSDFKAMKFKKDILETSLAKLSGEKEKYEALKVNVVEQIAELPLTINFIEKERELIEAAQKESFWVKADDSTFDMLGERLAGFMKHRESNNGGPGPVKLNLKDDIHKKEYVEFGPEHEALSIAKYRELVETRVRELVDKNPVLQKVSRGEAITKTEVEELARMLYEDHPHITVDLLRRVYDNRKAKFLQFIKHILGIEKLESFPESVSKSIDIFVQRHANLTSRQLEFLELLRGFIIDRGGFEKRDLIQSPFTQLHPQGIRGVFTPAEIDEILELTKELVA